LFGVIPVVSLGKLDELAAGRGIPGPPGSLWAKLRVEDAATINAAVSEANFMAIFAFLGNNGSHKVRSPASLDWSKSACLVLCEAYLA
jgi:hypothetical protein